MASDITREKDLESKVYKNEQRAEFIYLVLEDPKEFIQVIDDTQEIISLPHPIKIPIMEKKKSLEVFIL